MLTWNIHQTINNTLHATSVTGTTEQDIRKTIEACTDKAINLLKNNIQDDSLYLLFEWNTSNASLHIVVTDVTKNHDAPESVCCTLSNLTKEFSSQEQSIAYTESVKFWLHDYLTTCTAFFSYSLVAVFHSSTRNNTELL